MKALYAAVACLAFVVGGASAQAQADPQEAATLKALFDRPEGSFAQFIEFLTTTDPKFFHAGPEALLTGYRDIAKRIDAEMPRLFSELPRAPYGVRAMPSFQGPDAAEYYNGPAQDGSRGG